MEVLKIFESYLHQLKYQEVNTQTNEVDFEKLVAHYDHFLFDGFGTLYFEDKVFEDAKDCIQKLKAMGKQVRLVTNAASRTRLQLSEKLLGMGLGFLPNEIISSGSLLTTLNSSLKLKTAYHLGRESALEVLKNAKILHDINPQSKTVILSSVPPEGFKQENIDQAMNILNQEGSTLILLNPDVIAPYSESRYIEVAGFYADRLAKASACQVIKLGKPFPLIFEKSLYSLFPSNGSTLFIGDTLWTDIAGANHYGIDSALIERGNSNFSQQLGQNTVKILPNYRLKTLNFS